MKIIFRSCRIYVVRDKDQPQRLWLVFRFQTKRGVIKLTQRLWASCVFQKRYVTYYLAGSRR